MSEKELVIRYPLFNDTLDALEQCYESVGNCKEPDCKAVVGPSGSGKTTIGEELVIRHPSSDVGSRLDQPVPFIEIPSSPTVKSVAEAVLYGIHDPLWYTGNTFAKSIRFREICDKCNIRILALDDAQHLVDTKRNVPFEAAEWLKEQLIKSKISIVLFGLEKSLAVLRQNHQLRRRFGAPIRIGEFRWEVKEEREQYRALLNGVQKGLRELCIKTCVPEVCMPALDIDFCYRLNYASIGLLSYTMKIVTGAVRLAHRQHKDELTLKMFEHAYKFHVWDEGLTGPNPFSEEFDPKTAPKRELPSQQEPERPTRGRLGRKTRLKLVA